jgi:hypothetical protein
MAKVAGKPVYVVFLSVAVTAPFEQNAAGKGMAKIVQARTFAVGKPPKLKREFSKSVADRRIGKAIAGVVNEEKAGLRETFCSSRRIPLKGRYCRGMERNQTGSTFAFFHGNDSLLKIDIINAQPEGFGDAQASATQQTKQRGIG